MNETEPKTDLLYHRSLEQEHFIKLTDGKATFLLNLRLVMQDGIPSLIVIGDDSLNSVTEKDGTLVLWYERKDASILSWMLAGLKRFWRLILEKTN